MPLSKSSPLLLRLENVLYRLAEEFGDFERQWKTGIILLCFNGVDGLARDA